MTVVSLYTGDKIIEYQGFKKTITFTAITKDHQIIAVGSNNEYINNFFELKID